MSTLGNCYIFCVHFVELLQNGIVNIHRKPKDFENIGDFDQKDFENIGDLGQKDFEETFFLRIFAPKLRH